ncbi:secondary thiamine-phosphate synthase enzyme YjbQ [bacterium]|nr:secondary thiamine-phosphate synthase enzyme YjbQ [bacterium]MBU1153090.1 secondary thiamine-phosphate synthase enzyme YjbQ [bacterium]MBU2599125.1 secondary thiamine-phosphate synthase enzyme YjbQ [bacterium]
MVKTERISVKTRAGTDLVNITSLVSKVISDGKIKDGIVVIFVSGSTASVSTIEYEPNLIKDVNQTLEMIANSHLEYEHHKTWGDDNGASHVRATLLGPSLTVPFTNKSLLLGSWQQIILMDFDTKSRNREIILQIIGE